MNPLIAFSGEERKKGQYHNLKSLNFKDGEKRIVRLKDLAFPVALVTKIFKNENGYTGILHIVTNDLNSDADPICEVYQKRWRIEEYHKSIKQNTSLEKSPTKVVRSEKNHIFASDKTGWIFSGLPPVPGITKRRQLDDFSARMSKSFGIPKKTYFL